MPPTTPLGKSVYDRLPWPLQNLMASGYGLTTAAKTLRPSFHRTYAELLRTQYMSRDQLESLQSERLRSVVTHAYESVPYYRETLDRAGVKPCDIRGVEDLARLPLLTKETIRSRRAELMARNVDRRALYSVVTSGTTGSPLGVYWDRRTWETGKGVIWRCRSWAGYRPGAKVVSLTGLSLVPRGQTSPPFWRYDVPERRVLFSLFHLTRENLKIYADKMAALRPDYIEGYPSALYILARYLEHVGRYLTVKAVFTSSEPLREDQRNAIEARFAAPVFDYYGMAERAASAGQCEHRQAYHVSMEDTIVEVVERDGRLLPPGNVGEIVGTSLSNFAMPLIRYRTGDLGSLNGGTCACGRGLALMNQVETKCEDIVSLPDGRFISPSILTHPFKLINSIEKSQIVQEDMDHLVVRIVRRPDYAGEDSTRLLAGLRERLGNDMHIELSFEDDISYTSGGKYRFVVSKVPFGFQQ